MTRFVLASANPDKAEEIASILAGLGVEVLPRPDDVAEVTEDGETLEANARLKAEALCRATGLPAIADDTGLEVDALDGAPGVHSARFAGVRASYADNCVQLLDALEGLPWERRSARFTTVALARWPDGSERVARGAVEGHIADQPRGTDGFGYDPVFIPLHGDGRTFAEMSPGEKHARSHRGVAFRNLARALARLLDGPDLDVADVDEADVDGGGLVTTVDPDVATLLEVVAASPISWDDDTDVEAARGGWHLLLAAGTGCVEIDRVEDRFAGSGARGVPVRIYRPAGAEGVLVWFHGGGFVLGDLDSHDGLMRVLARRTGRAVVAVEYRRAPEHCFPAAQQDALVGWDWAVSHAPQLAGGTGAPAVGGDSAGGSLAAHVAIETRGGPTAPAALVLACPLTDFSDTAASPDPSASMRDEGDGYLLTADALAWFADNYVPEVDERRDPRVSVLYAPDLAGVARTLVITAEHDPLRDQGEAFAARLESAGVDVTRSRYDGTVHAFFGLVELLESGRRSLDEAAAFLGEGH